MALGIAKMKIIVSILEEQITPSIDTDLQEQIDEVERKVADRLRLIHAKKDEEWIEEEELQEPVEIVASKPEYKSAWRL